MSNILSRTFQASLLNIKQMEDLVDKALHQLAITYETTLYYEPEMRAYLAQQAHQPLLDTNQLAQILEREVIPWISSDKTCLLLAHTSCGKPFISGTTIEQFRQACDKVWPISSTNSQNKE